MPKTLMEQVEAEEKLLNPATEEDNEQGNESGKPEKPEPEAEHGAEPARQRGSRGRKRAAGRTGSGDDSGEAPQGEGEAPSGDGQAPPRDSRGARKDGGTPPEAARGADEGSGLKPPAEPAKPPEKPDVPDSPAAWARLRRRERELEAENKRLRDASLAPPQPKTEPNKLDEARAAAPAKVDDPEPDRTADPEAWRDWKIRDNDRWRATVEAERQAETRQRQVNEAVRSAIEEFQSVETSYSETNPDYFKATEFGRQKYTEAIKVMHPELNDRQIAQHIDYEIMKQASAWAQKGLNPAEEFYDYCIERLGYKPASAAEPEPEEPAAPEPEKPTAEEPDDGLEALANLHRGMPEKAPPARPKPNLKQINAARRRSASPLHGPGQGGSISVTKEAAAEMTMAEFAELSPSALAELEAMEE